MRRLWLRVALRGLEPSPEFIADAGEYADGLIDGDELVARGLRRWGLA